MVHAFSSWSWIRHAELNKPWERNLVLRFAGYLIKSTPTLERESYLNSNQVETFTHEKVTQTIYCTGLVAQREKNWRSISWGTFWGGSRSWWLGDQVLRRYFFVKYKYWIQTHLWGQFETSIKRGKNWWWRGNEIHSCWNHRGPNAKLEPGEVKR